MYAFMLMSIWPGLTLEFSRGFRESTNRERVLGHVSPTALASKMADKEGTVQTKAALKQMQGDRTDERVIEEQVTL